MTADDGRHTQFLILPGSRVSLREQNIGKLAAFLGCDPRIPDARADAGSIPNAGTGRAHAVALSADALIEAAGSSGARQTLDRLGADDTQVLIFGWRAVTPHADAIRQITQGAIADIQPLGARTSCSVTLEGRDWTRQLSGTRFERSSASADAGFVTGRGESECHPLLTCGDLATFAAVNVGRHALFFVADADVADMDEPVPEDGLPERWPAILPYLIFVKAVFGEACWHSALQTTRLIIDDPLLKRRYGLLNYETLFRSMDAVGYGSTIAFIPWNYRRTSRRNADYFRDQSARGRFSICVHGCDHTGAEFASCNVPVLEHRAALALERLASQQARTGVAFERVMVFPQGKFSRAAAMALRRTAYRAAVNTSAFPVDHRGALTLRDLLAPAVTRFHGFPIFGRHYPKQSTTAFALALDLYLGRPAFIVEHQEFFGDGMPMLESLVRDLHQRSPGLQSLPLIDAVTQVCLRRRTGAGSTEIRFFTDRFSIDNPGSALARYTLIKDEPDPSFIDAVAVNGASVPFRTLDGRIEIDVDAAPGARIDVAVGVRSGSQATVTFGSAYHAKVLGRRALSEFRDEVLSRYPAAFSLAKRSVRFLSTMTKGSGARGGA